MCALFCIALSLNLDVLQSIAWVWMAFSPFTHPKNNSAPHNWWHPEYNDTRNYFWIRNASYLKKGKDESGAVWGEGNRSWSGGSLRRVGGGKEQRGAGAHREKKEVNAFRKKIKITGDCRNLGCSKEWPSSGSHSSWPARRQCLFSGWHIMYSFSKRLLSTDCVPNMGWAQQVMGRQQHQATIQMQSYNSRLEAKAKEGPAFRVQSGKASWKRRLMRGFEARTKPDPRGPGPRRQQRALTVWCKRRLSEAPAFFLCRDPTRCTEMAADFLNMPPRATGTDDFSSRGRGEGSGTPWPRAWVSHTQL